MRTQPLLHARIAEFAYHGAAAPVLHDADITAEPGTLTAVLGGSGSGKSTLGRLLAGWLSGANSGLFKGSLHLGAAARTAPGRDPGPLVFSGSPDDPRINPALWSHHVGYVPQDAAALLSTVGSTVAEELAFGLENRGVPRDRMHRDVAAAAEAAGLSALLERDPATLSGGELRRLAVACCAITRPGVLVLDEPLASLDEAGAASVRTLVRALVESGTAVIVLSQAADPLAFEASRWLVLDGGTVTGRGTPAELAGGRELLGSGVVLPGPAGYGAGVCRSAAIRQSEAVQTGVSSGTGTAVLELDRVTFSFPARRKGKGADVLHELNLAVRPGTVVAVTGPNGAGKSTLLRHFNGLLRPDRGSVQVSGTDISGIPTGKAADQVGLLFQHPRDQLFERTVLREVLFGLDRKFGLQTDAKARAALASVGLGEELETHPHELPASAQRLLALATVVAREPDLMALDEPTVGLDRHGLARLCQVMDAAVARGAAVVMVTHDLAFARATADHILCLSGGRLREA
ncbi:ABC transporter ATP-binding protein [Arthrobacter sp. 24S4-2]|uniref:ABC transporter ATP-binding protein n=1 Tax=Arthrobacter sp. 24S4-2 TaxID=2575374 RepID=UPI0010C77A1B|nr:ABC transporter ATP-binding protein [Arthrobacter sp. 24S4-2]QCO97867.1 ABC transporter ATP-binding protein [Arthrobacter sp. 24S4-2]